MMIGNKLLISKTISNSQEDINKSIAHAVNYER